MRVRLGCIVLFSLSAGSAGAAGFVDLGVAGGQATGMSRNGRIVSGSLGGAGAWRWAKDRGAVTLAGFTGSQGMSSWGQPVAGGWTNAEGDTVAALAFTNSELLGGPQVVGGYPGATAVDHFLSEAYDASDTGVAVGLAYDDAGLPIAFRWTESDGMQRLAVARPTTYSRANASSADGRVIVGWNDLDDGYRAGVVWRDGVVTDLLDGGGVPVGEAGGVSSDGTWVVGSDMTTSDGSSAWRWSAATGVQALGIPPQARAAHAFHADPDRVRRIADHPERAQPRLGDSVSGFFPVSSLAFAVSDDGSVVVGRAGAFPTFSATVWTPAGGNVALADYAAAHGVDVPSGWTLMTADTVSADGLTIGGWGTLDGALGSFVVDLHGPPAPETRLEAHGTVDFNSLSGGPFAGVAVGTPVTLRFHLQQADAFEIEPGEDTAYAIAPETFALSAGGAIEMLAAGGAAPVVHIANDYPRSDGIHLFGAPLATDAYGIEFELFNPGGDLFDSDDLERIDRSVDASFFEKVAWTVSHGDEAMSIALATVELRDVDPLADVVFADGFDAH